MHAESLPVPDHDRCAAEIVAVEPAGAPGTATTGWQRHPLVTQIEELRRHNDQLREDNGQLAAQLAAAELKIANLEIALHSARRIGAAMGILMARHRITLDAAFDRLRTASQHAHRKLRDIAEDVVHTGTLDFPGLRDVHRFAGATGDHSEAQHIKHVDETEAGRVPPGARRPASDAAPPRS